MKLYYVPGVCSLASHIALREAGLAFALDKMDCTTRRTACGENYLEANPKLPSEWRENQVSLLAKRFDYLTQRLDNRPHLMGERFTVADAYLFVVLGWSPRLKVDLNP